MSLKNTDHSYGSLSKFFHWLIFLFLVGAIIAGNLDAAMPDGPEKTEALAMHKSFGVLILMVLLLSLLWKLLNPTPAHSKDVPAWQQTTSRLVHWLLYVLMFAQPISGVLMSQSFGYPVSFFGLFDVPTVVGTDKELGKLIHEAHQTIWIVLAVIASGHIAVALHHHFVRKNDVLRRMLRES
jgi:cytochrome b561